MRYRVLDLPVAGAGAFTPLAATPPMASSWGTVVRTGAPGTLAIPAPKPSSLVPISADPLTQGSNVSPNVRTPDIYVAFATNMGPRADAGIGMATRRLAPMPVPALSWISSARKAMVGRRMGGRQAAAWPRAFQRFPTRQPGGGNAT